MTADADPLNESRDVAVDAFAALSPAERRFVEARLQGGTLADSYRFAHPGTECTRSIISWI